jgi:membrane protein
MVALKSESAPRDEHPMRRGAAILKEAGVRWWDDGCDRMGASLAFYALFSIFPLVLIAVVLLGILLGRDPGSQERLVASVSGVVSPQFRALLDATLTSLQSHQKARGVGAGVGIVTLVFGASGVFSELQISLNAIWRVQAAPSSAFRTTILRALEDKAISLAAVGVAGAVLLTSLFVGIGLSALGGAAPSVPGALFWRGIDAIVSLGTVTLIFVVVFRLIPRTYVAWRDVIGGAFVTALLFNGLKGLFTWYLGHIGSYAAYGAVGGVLGLLMWIYLVSLLVFFGAEVTRVYAERDGSRASEGSRAREAAGRSATGRGAGARA